MPPSTVTGVSPTRINLVQTAGDATSHNIDNDWTITGTRIQVIEDHNTPVYTVCFSLDNNRVALSRMIGWDLEAKGALASLEGHETGFRSLAWSHDGTKLASGS
jgi:WD40 repeat protein